MIVLANMCYSLVILTLWKEYDFCSSDSINNCQLVQLRHTLSSRSASNCFPWWQQIWLDLESHIRNLNLLFDLQLRHVGIGTPWRANVTSNSLRLVGISTELTWATRHTWAHPFHFDVHYIDFELSRTVLRKAEIGHFSLLLFNLFISNSSLAKRISP